ncbi:MerR family transcriptional regulator [Desulfosporosinus sp. PR]|uniref:MerR family transcriptional regulator n=1 Tax=Candidatus Desulfosporosinus nitrosoreducens TaxID=3401928 RepID=UPI0027EC9DCB|nr:MerR family transcriptional regulator [Desulfosporosinus sp. PR]MDQ7092918.1 MerR family transcriptional regulator [Desulfosporosinus sp. PR]
MYKVGEIAKRFGISRTTLLYYDSIDLFSPSTRTDAGYRLYSQEDCEKLKKIMTYREAGLSTENIKELLIQQKDEEIISPLFKKLGDLNQQIKTIKQQQMLLINLIKEKEIIKKRLLSDEVLKLILERADIKYEERMNWHAEFEEQSSQRHYEFLQSLGTDEEEIKLLKEKLKNY